MRIEILESAQQDLIAGHAFYESQAQGRRFVSRSHSQSM